MTSTAQASPTTYQITQGFSEGATAIARFIGDDIDGDGWLTSDDMVITYTIDFTGNSFVPSFSLPGIPSFRLSLFPKAGSIQDGPVHLAPDEFLQQAATQPPFWYVRPTCTSSDGVSCRGRISSLPGDYSFNAPVLSIDATLPAPIPVPATVWLFGSSLIGLIGANRRKQQNHTIA